MSSTGRGAVRQEFDNYPTPAWCVERFLEAVELPGDCWLEPCAGDGAIVDAVKKYRRENTLYAPEILWVAGDIREEVLVNLRATAHYANTWDWLDINYDSLNDQYDVLITNPPYNQAEKFVRKGLGVAKNVVMLLRLNFMGSENRADFLRTTQPDVYVLPNRPSFTGKGTDSTEYAWFHWHAGSQGLLRVLNSTPLTERRGCK